MNRQMLINTVKVALQKASGKPIGEAAEIVADSIEMIEAIVGDVPLPIRSNIENSVMPQVTPPASGFRPEPVAKKDPITPEELDRAVESGFPLDLEVNVRGSSIKLLRSVIKAAQEDAYYGLKVSYAPEKYNANTPVCAISIWASDGYPDCHSMVASIKEMAVKVYGHVAGPAVPHAPAPQAIRIGQMADV